MKRITELDTGLEGDTEDPQELLRRAVSSMTDRHLRKQLENWTLKNFFGTYNREHLEKFEWVEADEAPDYWVFENLDSHPLPVEVTEILDPNRKRDREYRSALAEAERTGDYVVASDAPWPPPDYDERLIQHASRLLGQKLSKKYPDGSWLVVYFNAEPFGLSPDDKLAYAVRIVRSALDTLGSPERIAQVWLLTNNLSITQVCAR